MAEIVESHVEKVPALRLIGKRYTNADRDANGSFSNKWDEWLASDRFRELMALGPAAANDSSYIGLCICLGSDFEYWIGIFFSAGIEAPEGYECKDLPAGEVGVCQIYGRPDTGELYGEKADRMCAEKLKSLGHKVREKNPPHYEFERYNCPRFTTPDDAGKVILDYGIYLDR